LSNRPIPVMETEASFEFVVTVIGTLSAGEALSL
jgi:hypothetical protein